jgi:hypothetical protein
MVLKSRRVVLEGERKERSMATPHTAVGNEPLEASPLGQLIAFPVVIRREGAGIAQTGSAEILFFTGVRYERQTAPADTTCKSPGRRSSPRQAGPRRQA